MRTNALVLNLRSRIKDFLTLVWVRIIKYRILTTPLLVEVPLEPENLEPCCREKPGDEELGSIEGGGPWRQSLEELTQHYRFGLNCLGSSLKRVG